MRQDKSAILIQRKLVSLPRRVSNILTIIMLVSLAAFSHPALANGDLAYQKAKSSFEAGDVGSAVLWLEKAVGQGNMPAHLPLAAMYRDGHGVKLDYDRAVSLFTRAAEYGYPSAQFSLGVMYRLGRGCVETLFVFPFLRCAA